MAVQKSVQYYSLVKGTRHGFISWKASLGVHRVRSVRVGWLYHHQQFAALVARMARRFVGACVDLLDRPLWAD